jgi:cytochrome b subunit of formate dehydrogenase
MSDPHFKRFSGFHRVLHWVIAIPYIVLLGSGALILLGHLGWVHGFATAFPAALHRWVGMAFAGIVLELVFAALVGGHWRNIFRDFLAWFLVRPRDIVWLMLVPLNSLLPGKFPLPPAGRFNAGQKLHGLFILIAVIGFIISGLMMILVPGWLTIWLVHAWLFFGAAGFLGLHLFLALINSPTRPALSGIFTGNVPHSYVRDHHALELHPAQEHSPHAAVSLKAMILVSMVIAGGLFIWWQGSGRGAVLATVMSPNKHAMIFPASLISAHSAALVGNDCAACHTHSGPTTNDACLACHVEIRKVLEQSAGYHGTLTGECATCHNEHHGADADLRNFNSRAFNHDLAKFTLKGAHRSLACAQCHLNHSPTAGQMRYIGIKSPACVDCHSNPHADMPAANCTQCHSEQGWTGRSLLFVHNRDSTFKLDATHDTLSCTSCHKPAGKTLSFVGTPTSCERCHTKVIDAMTGKFASLVMKPDPHAGRVACAECHLPGVRPQEPRQYAQQCQRCHGGRYRTLFFNWEKSLDEHEQSARLRLRQAAATPGQLRLWSELIEQAHSAGFHNAQQAIEAFEKVGR